MTEAKVKKVKAAKQECTTAQSIEVLAQQSMSLKNIDKKDLPQPDPLPIYDSKFSTIHNYVVECDTEKEWKEIKDWIQRKPLSLKDAMEMLAVQPDLAIRSRRLALLAEKELERFTLDFKERTGVLRELALEYWEERKKGGLHKQITVDMIEDWITEHYGDTWTEMKMRVRDMHNAKNLLEQLSEQVISRAPDLRKMIDKFAEKTADPSWFTVKTSKKGSK
jgi:hypothetical protein